MSGISTLWSQGAACTFTKSFHFAAQHVLNHNVTGCMRLGDHNQFIALYSAFLGTLSALHSEYVGLGMGYASSTTCL